MNKKTEYQPTGRATGFGQVSVFALSRGRSVHGRPEWPPIPQDVALSAEEKNKVIVHTVFDELLQAPSIIDSEDGWTECGNLAPIIRYYLVDDRGGYLPIRLPDDIQYLREYSDPAFMVELRAKAPRSWWVHCDSGSCQKLIPVIMQIIVNGRMSRTTKKCSTYCPHCYVVKMRKKGISETHPRNKRIFCMTRTPNAIEP